MGGSGQNELVVCPRCGKENEAGDKYCSRCGLEFAKVAKSEPRASGEALFCFWHPKEATQLTCGKCERPICTRCVINGPAGIRCKECGRTKIKTSARGLAHDASRPFMQTLGYYARQPFALIFLFFICSGMVRGCMVCRTEPERIPPDYYEQPIEPPSENPPKGMEKV